VDISLNRMQENLYLYVGTAGGNDLFVVDIDSQKKVDSLYFPPGNMNRLYITPDGSKLYVTQLSPTYATYYLDTKSRTYHPTNFPKYSRFFFNDNKEGYILSFDGIFRLNPFKDQFTKIDTFSLEGVIALNKVTPVIYFVQNEKLYSYDFIQKIITDSLSLPPAWNMEMTPDNQELYFTTPNGLLGVINIQSGTVEYITNANPNGKIAITPDGKYVLVTDPGSNFNPSPGSGLLIVVRTSNHSLDGYIEDVWGGKNIVITPTSNLAIVNNSIGIYFIDLPQRRTLKYFRFYPYGATIRSLALGSKQK